MQKKAFKGIADRPKEEGRSLDQDNVKEFIQSVTLMGNIRREIEFILREETDWISVRQEHILFTSEELFVIHVRTDSIANSMVCRFINRLNGLNILPWIDDYVIKTNGFSDCKLTFIYATDCDDCENEPSDD